MSIDIRKIAREATTLSELMEGREKIETEDIIKYYKNGITINKVDCVSIIEDEQEKNIYVYTFKEEPKKFAFSGYVLKKIFDNILYAMGGDVGALNNELEKEDFKVILKAGKTKDGKRNVTIVEVL